jgi:ketosteroid isomerase-like protein
MPNRDVLTTVRQAFDAWNAHDVKSLQALLADDYVWESDTLPAPVRGPDGHRQAMEMYLQAFPDLHFEIVQMLSCGDGNQSTRGRSPRMHGPRGREDDA